MTFAQPFELSILPKHLASIMFRIKYVRLLHTFTVLSFVDIWIINEMLQTATTFDWHGCNLQETPILKRALAINRLCVCVLGNAIHATQELIFHSISR